MLFCCALALSILAAPDHVAGDIAVGDRPSHTFSEAPFGLPGLQRLEELRGAATLIVFADPAQTKGFAKIAAEASAVRKRYAGDLAVILVAPPAESSWREAHAQRCFAGGVAFSTEEVVAAPAGVRPFAVVLDAFGEVLHAEKASLDLDAARKAVEIAVTGVKSAEAYAPGELGSVWKSFEKGLVQQGLDELAKLEKSSDATMQQMAATAMEWWRPRVLSPLERAERLLAEQRWSEARSLLDAHFARFPGLAKAQDPVAERARAARAQIPTDAAARAADEALEALTQEIVRKGPTKALREKLARLAADAGEERVAARAKTLLLRLAP
ncbi:MAG: hypothetical protein JNM84_04565 [Planctomycetes bacterium]|nr:hypothetical protein [Planctomycetota bacterium]